MNISFKSHRNPYILGRPVNQDLLFGRESLFVDIDNYLQEHKRVKKVLVLYGQRRIGKSSIVRNITDKLKELHNNKLDNNFAIVTLSLEYYSQQSLGTVLAELAKEIISDLSLEDKNIELPEITKLESDYDVFSKEFLPQVYQALNGKNLVLALDDFDIFINTHPEISLRVFYGNLFSIIEKDKKLFLILVMDHKLLKSSKKIRKFQNVTTIKEINLLDEHTTTNLIKQPAQKILEYGEDAIQHIFHLSAGHPYFTQVICFVIFSKVRENNNFDNKVNSEDVERIVDKAIELAEASLSWFWEEFSIMEKVVLSAVAESQDTSEDYLQLIKSKRIDINLNLINLIIETKEYLQENDFLDSTYDKVKIELFRKWIIKTHPLNEEISQLEKLTLVEKQGDGQLQGEDINENNNIGLSQIIENIPTNTMPVWDNDRGYDIYIEPASFKLTPQIKTYNHGSLPLIGRNCEVDEEVYRNEEVDTPQKRRAILIIISLVCLFVTSSIILATIYRLYTKPCREGEKKEFGVLCLVDDSRISRGDRTFFPNIDNDFLDNEFRDKGIQAFKEGEYEKAAELFTKAIEANKKVNQNDPEVLIYYNNARANMQGSPFARLAVVISVISIGIGNNTQDTSNAKEILRGVAQAQNEFNEKRKGGRLIEIVVANDSNDKNKAEQVAQELVKDDSILGVIGHNSIDTTQAALPKYQKAGLAIISPTSIAKTLKTNKTSDESVLFSSFSSDKNEIPGKEFTEKSQKLWGENIDISLRTATSYDATQGFIKALSLSPNNSRSRILRNLQEVTLPPKETSGDPVEFKQ